MVRHAVHGQAQLAGHGSPKALRDGHHRGGAAIGAGRQGQLQPLAAGGPQGVGRDVLGGDHRRACAGHPGRGDQQQVLVGHEADRRRRAAAAQLSCQAPQRARQVVPGTLVERSDRHRGRQLPGKVRILVATMQHHDLDREALPVQAAGQDADQPLHATQPDRRQQEQDALRLAHGAARQAASDRPSSRSSLPMSGSSSARSRSRSSAGMAPRSGLAAFRSTARR